MESIEKSDFYGFMGWGYMKNQYIGSEFPKKGGLNSLQISEGAGQKREGDVFDVFQELRPQWTLWIGEALLLTQWLIGIKYPKQIILCNLLVIVIKTDT